MTKIKQTPLERMRAITNSEYDPEDQHSKANQLLCSLVREFVPNGREIVKEYQNIKKWYA